MRLQRIFSILGACVIVLVGSTAVSGAASAKATMLTDGSFERPALANGATSRGFATGQHVGVWDVTSGAVFTSATAPPIVTAPRGTQMLGLRPLPLPSVGDGEICQTVHGMNPGSTYKIRLSAASVVSGSTIDVTLGAQTAGHLDIPGTVPAQFAVYELRVTAPAGSARLCLHGHPLDSGSVPLIDTVRFNPTAT